MSEGHIAIPEGQMNLFVREAIRDNGQVEAIVLECHPGHVQVTCDVRAVGLRQRLILDVVVVDFEISLARQTLVLNLSEPKAMQGRSLAGRLLRRIVQLVLNRMVRSERVAGTVARQSDNLVTLDWPNATIHLDTHPAIHSALQIKVGHRPMLELVALTRCEMQPGQVMLFFETPEAITPPPR